MVIKVRFLVRPRIHNLFTMQQTYHNTIVNSNIWKAWTKHAEEHILFDMPESIECDLLSDAHWDAFIKWVRDTK